MASYTMRSTYVLCRNIRRVLNQRKTEISFVITLLMKFREKELDTLKPHLKVAVCRQSVLQCNKDRCDSIIKRHGLRYESYGGYARFTFIERFRNVLP